MKTVNSPKRASQAQVQLFRALHAKADIVLSPSRLRRFRGLTVGQASLEIQRIKTELEAFAFTGYVAPAGMATAKQLAFFSKMRHRLGEPVTSAELDALKVTSTADMQLLNSMTMRKLQEHNDAHGVPLPAWRLTRGLYDPEVVREGQRAAAARQAERRQATCERIKQRQEAHRHRRRVQVYPGEFV